jgi:hypothetical protein
VVQKASLFVTVFCGKLKKLYHMVSMDKRKEIATHSNYLHNILNLNGLVAFFVRRVLIRVLFGRRWNYYWLHLGIYAYPLALRPETFGTRVMLA